MESEGAQAPTNFVDDAWAGKPNSTVLVCPRMPKSFLPHSFLYPALGLLLLLSCNMTQGPQSGIGTQQTVLSMPSNPPQCSPSAANYTCSDTALCHRGVPIMIIILFPHCQNRGPSSRNQGNQPQIGNQPKRYQAALAHLIKIGDHPHHLEFVN